MKNARAKRAKILFFIVKYANLWGFCCRRRRGCLSSLIMRIDDFVLHCNSNLHHTVSGWPGKRVTYWYLLYVALADEVNFFPYPSPAIFLTVPLVATIEVVFNISPTCIRRRQRFHNPNHRRLSSCLLPLFPTFPTACQSCSFTANLPVLLFKKTTKDSGI